MVHFGGWNVFDGSKVLSCKMSSLIIKDVLSAFNGTLVASDLVISCFTTFVSEIHAKKGKSRDVYLFLMIVLPAKLMLNALKHVHSLVHRRLLT